MDDAKGSDVNANRMNPVWSSDLLAFLKDNGIVCAVIAAVIIPVLVAVVLGGRKKSKQRGCPVLVGGEAGFAMRNARSVNLVEVPWEGAGTLADLFEQSCKKHSQERFLGTRKVISKDVVTSSDGRKFEKFHLGEYQWETYGKVLERVSNFASGLIKLGHHVDTRAAIFADTRAMWLMAFEVILELLHFSEQFCDIWVSICMFPPPLLKISSMTRPLRCDFFCDFRDASGRALLSLPFMLH